MSMRMRAIAIMNWTEIIQDGLKLLAVGLLVLLNAFFVAAELALVRIRDTQLEALGHEGRPPGEDGAAHRRAH